MRNTIPCTAVHIALLEPSMIQAIVEQKAFQRGHEYFKMSRVRLLDADDTDIAATVRGNSGVYEQTIRLRDGNLVTACSCSLIEQPMCRHCVAVLLEYHRWSSHRGRREAQNGAEPRASKEGRAAASASNGNVHGTIDHDLRLSEVIAFFEWARPAMQALAKSEALPEAPRLPAGVVSDWVETLAELERRHRDQEEIHHALHADLAQRDHQLLQLAQELKAAQQELGSAHEASRRLEQEVAGYRAVIGKLRELSKNIARFDGDMKAVAGDLSKSQAHLEHLAQSFRDVSLALQDLAKQRVP